MKHSFGVSNGDSPKFDGLLKEIPSRVDSNSSSDTQELIERSLNMIHDLSSLLEKDTYVDVSGCFDIRRCQGTPQSSRSSTKIPVSSHDLSSHCTEPDIQSIHMKLRQRPLIPVNSELGSAKRELRSNENLQPALKKLTNGCRAFPTSKPLGVSSRRSPSDEHNLPTSDDESSNSEDDEIESRFQDTQIGNFCISKYHKGDDVVASKTVKSVLQIFEILCERYSQGKALKILKRKFKFVDSSKKYLGAVPGVEVGDFFYSKVELSIVGLHHDLQAGIECIEHEGISVAASIVSSSYRGDDSEDSDTLIYPGSEGYSGYSLKGGRLSIDRKLEIGIMALKNSIEACTPVRVIYYRREEESKDSRTGKSKKAAACIYDGLYMVEKYWFVSRGDGFSTYNFLLRRKPGQQKVDVGELLMLRPFKMRFGLRMEDLSDGKEKIPVSVMNVIDSSLPDSFTYITEMMYPSLKKMKPSSGCDCINGCSDLVKCACVIKNGGEIPFNCEGGIIRAKPLVYECGPACKCPPSCQNRVSQLGFEYRLEVFKTKSRGWGLRSQDNIPMGSFICEYVGEMLLDAEAGKRENDEYLFDIGRNYHDESLWEGLSSVPNLEKYTVLDGQGFTIDAANFGNVGRFINHSCTPNLYAQNTLYDHDDERSPRIMFFSSEDIFAYEELTYHYNYCIDGVRGSDGKIKRKECHCGSDECTGRLY